MTHVRSLGGWGGVGWWVGGVRVVRGRACVCVRVQHDCAEGVGCAGTSLHGRIQLGYAALASVSSAQCIRRRARE